MVRRGRNTTIRGLARRAGVSPATVSRVLNHAPGVSETLRRRVLTALGRSKAVGDAARAAALRRGTGTLGLIVPDITNPFYAESARIIIDACQGRGYTVIVCNAENLPALHRRQVELLRRRRVDGIILGAVLLDDAETEALVASGYPCLQFNRRLRSGRGSYVVADNVRAGRDITAHLIALGHRRIGFIAGTPEASTAVERLAGYRAALEEAGIEYDADLVREGLYQSRAAQGAAEVLLKQAPGPTAMIGGNDAMALSVLQAAGEHAIRVPEEIAVAGIDDIGIAAHHNIQLTTVSHHAAEMAGLAATWMMEIVQDPARFAREPFQHVIRPTLIIRRTCGAVR
jgi:LacI family transcriptional regulator, galactose operon repressor